MCVTERGWLAPVEFEDAISTVNLLPGPASTQLAIYCAWRLRGALGAVIGGVCFIVPGLVVILALSAVLLGANPPAWVIGAAAGAGAAVPAVAVNAAWGFVPGSLKRMGETWPNRSRWITYAIIGAAVAATAGTYLVLALLSCGILEVLIRGGLFGPGVFVRRSPNGVVAAVVAHVAVGGLGGLVWVAFKVGGLSYGGGFVIVPLMQHDAVSTYHWMSGAQFLAAVALGQITPGPVVLTVAVVGYAASGLGGGVLAVLVAFGPSFAFVVAGGPRFDRLRANVSVSAFLTGAGPAVIGAIAGSAVPLGLALSHRWQAPILAGGLVWLFVVRRGVVSGLLIAGAVGVVVALSGVAV
jgi:chromate transporter